MTWLLCPGHATQSSTIWRTVLILARLTSLTLLTLMITSWMCEGLLYIFDMVWQGDAQKGVFAKRERGREREREFGCVFKQRFPECGLIQPRKEPPTNVMSSSSANKQLFPILRSVVSISPLNSAATF